MVFPPFFLLDTRQGHREEHMAPEIYPSYIYLEISYAENLKKNNRLTVEKKGKMRQENVVHIATIQVQGYTQRQCIAC